MKSHTLVILNHKEIQQVSGGVNHRGINYRPIIMGALSSASIKACSYWIEALLPKGKKGTFLGEAWNGVAKFMGSFSAIVSLGIGGAYVVKAVQEHPKEE